MNRIVLFIICMCGAGSALAETKYVTDKLTITMRAGQDVSYRIVRTLPSGTPAAILETADNGYSRVRIADNEEGWVLSQYLENEPAAREKLVAVEAQLAKLKEENTRMKKELTVLKDDYKQQQDQLKKTSGDQENASRELSRLRQVAADPIRLSEENAVLKGDTEKLRNELQQLQEQNQLLQDNSNKIWFSIGGGVLLGGLLLGLIIPKIRWRRSSTWH